MKKSQNAQTIYVEGMHCASCELLIEKTIEDYPGVKDVDASLEKGQVKIVSDKNDSVDIEKLNKDFKEAGYKFSNKQFPKENYKLIELTDAGIEINREKFYEYLKIFGILVFVLVLVMLINNSNIGRYAGVDANSSLPAFLVLGIVAGLSSCAALVGGLLLVMTKQWNDLYITDKTNKLKFQPHILFHTGRLIGYFVFGGLLGLLGQVVSIGSGTSFAIVIIAVSVVMLVLALQMIGVKQAQNLQLKTPKVISKFITNESNFSGKYAPFILGALTFLLPCGFTLIAQAAALASSGFLKGGLIMLLFAIGTLPILGGISLTGVKFNTKPKLTSLFNKTAGILIVVFAIYTINSQLNVLGLKSLSDLELRSNDTASEKVDKEVSENPDVDENVQKLVIVADDFSYTPQGSMTIEADKPTVMAVNNKGVQGCGRFMAARGLIDKYVELEDGWNYVELTPKKGVYKLTCTMGMVRPVTITVI
jgi:sulfite exporter TauE/SafE/copper chaperone CopZ